MPTETNLASDSVVYAKTSDGLVLPVVDITRPPFAVPDDPASNAGLRDTFVEWLRKQQRGPRFLTKLMMRLAARRSRLLRALFEPDHGYLESITTYIMKLCVGHLPP